MKSLKTLAAEHQCDKAAEGHHTYDGPYEFYFGSLRDKPVKLFEIGVGGYSHADQGGNSLRMWKEYFGHPDTQILAMDLHNKSKIEGVDQFTIFEGSQSDEAFLDSIADKIAGANIIIDDGSHVNRDQQISFKKLFPLLKDGGIYVIEDTHTAFFKHYGGGNTDNTVEFIKSLINGLYYKSSATEMRNDNLVPGEPNYFELNITSINFYNGMIFITKGDNSVTA